MSPLFREVTAAITLWVFTAQVIMAQAPGWWSQRGVIQAGRQADDYAVINQGQLKNLAVAAYHELDNNLTEVGGAGDQLDSLMAGWSASTSVDNYAVVTVGQLKQVAKPFYERLHEVGQIPVLPRWISIQGTDDHAVANTGQAKRLFAFHVEHEVADLGYGSQGFADADDIGHEASALEQGGASALTSSSPSHYSAAGGIGNRTSPTAIPNNPEDIENDMMASLPAEFKVNADGSASYVASVEIPKGVGGVEPTITLEYHSNSGNGVAGVGWSIGGFMAINRGPSTKAVDGVDTPVNFSATDRFYLDGERLVCVAKTYGADNSEYRTLKEQFSKIVYHSSTDLAEQGWFEVRTKGGLRMEFGNSPTSKIKSSAPQHTAKAVTWALNRVEDSAGNYYLVEYTAQPDEELAISDYQPLSVKFTGNSTEPTLPMHEVRFKYSTDRKDVERGYLLGGSIVRNRRLEGIEVATGNHVLRSYVLDYRYSSRTGRSLLKSLQEVAGSLADAASLPAHKKLPPTTFDWEAGVPGWKRTQLNDLVKSKGRTSTTASLKTASEEAKLLMRDKDLGDRGAQFLDIDGDGLTDVLISHYGHDHTGGRFKQVFRNKGDGTWEDKSSWLPEGFPFLSTQTGDSTGAVLIDVNGDGLTDVVSSGTFAAFNKNWGEVPKEVWVDTIEISKRKVFVGQKTNVRDQEGDKTHYYELVNEKWKLQVLKNNGWSVGSETVEVEVPKAKTSAYKIAGKELTVPFPKKVQVKTVMKAWGWRFDKMSVANSTGVWLNTGKGWAKSSQHDLPQVPTKAKNLRSHVAQGARTTLYDIEWGDCKMATYNNQDLGWRAVDLDGDGFQDLVRAGNEIVADSGELCYALRNPGPSAAASAVAAGASSLENSTGVGSQSGSGVQALVASGPFTGSTPATSASGDTNTETSPLYLATQLPPSAFIAAAGQAAPATSTSNYWQVRMDGIWELPMPLVDADGRGDLGRRLMDINGDGFVDFIYQSMEDPDGTGAKPAQRCLRAFINKGGKEWVAEDNWLLWEGLTYGTKFSSWGRFFDDINGDGLPDYIAAWAYVDGAGKTQRYDKVYLNTGEGWTEDKPELHLPGPVQMSLADGSLRTLHRGLQDMDGDGRPEYYDGWKGSFDNSAIEAQRPTPTSTVNFEKVVVKEMWQDGTAAAYVGTAKKETSTRIGLSGAGEVWRYSNATGKWELCYDKNGEGKYCIPAKFLSSNGSSSPLQWVDINGDGLVELLHVSDAGTEIHWNAQRPELISQFKNGMGVPIRVEYDTLARMAAAPAAPDIKKGFQPRTEGTPRSAWPLTDVVPVQWVARCMETEDGTYKNNGSPSTTRTYYNYGGLRFHHLHGNLGFEWMEVMNTKSATIERTDFRQDYPYIGLPSVVTSQIVERDNTGGITGYGVVLLHSRTEYKTLSTANVSERESTLPAAPAAPPAQKCWMAIKKLSGTPVKYTIAYLAQGPGISEPDIGSSNFWSSVDYSTGTTNQTQPPLLPQSSETVPTETIGSLSAKFVYAEKNVTVKRTPEDFPAGTVTQTFEYDDWGNLTLQETSSDDGAKVKTVNEFAAAATEGSEWKVGLLQKATTTHTAPTAVQGTPGHEPIIKSAEFTYDPDTGMLESEETDPDTDYWTKKVYERDNFGNVTKTTVSVKDGGDPLVSETRYNADGRFAVASRNAIGHTVVTEYDEDKALAKATSMAFTSTGALPDSIPEGTRKTTVNYDAWGTARLTTGPDGVRTVKYTKAFSGSAVKGAVYYVYAQVEGTCPVVTYYDKYHRALLTEKTAFDGRAIYQTVEYNAKGMAVKGTKPYFAGTDLTTVGVTETQYDRFDRKVKMIAPGKTDADAPMESTVKFSGFPGASAFTSQAINHRNQTMTQTLDAQGRVVATLDHVGQKVEFDYAADGQPLKATTTINDASKGSTITTTYNSRRLKESVTDPNTGKSETFYDAWGRVSEMHDNTGNKTVFEYDNAGRTTERRTVPAGNANADYESLTTWTYDVVTATSNGLGKVDTVTIQWQPKVPGGPIPTSTETVTYDSLGRVKSTSRTLANYSAFNGTYTSSVEYDDLGRATTSTDASGQTTVNVFNNYGFLSDVRRGTTTGTLLWRGLSYDAEGHMLKEVHGNGITTDFEYHPDRGNLTKAKSYRPAAEGGVERVIQTLEMEVSDLGNVEWRKTTTPGAEGGDPVVKYEDYQFDDLNRLTTSEVTGQGPQSYTFEGNGNIKTKAGIGTYSYGQTETAGQDWRNAVTSVALTSGGTRSYTYDLNGRMVHEYSGAVGAGEPLRTLRYTSFGQPSLITHRASPVLSSDLLAFTSPVAGMETFCSVGFEYDAGLSRLIQTKVKGGGLITRVLYMGSYELRETFAGTTRIEREERSSFGNGTLVKLYQGDNAVPTVRDEYALEDHLGSPTGIYDGSGDVVQGRGVAGQAEQHSYDPWGRRRNAGTWGAAAPVNVPAGSARTTDTGSTPAHASMAQAHQNVLTGGAPDGSQAGSGTADVQVAQLGSSHPRGFTGHEMLDDLGLIHMNGRLYDSALGRFCSADPYVQSPGNVQNYNRYTYVLNNPVSLVDPSGHFFGILFAFIGWLFTSMVAVIGFIITTIIIPLIKLAYLLLKVAAKFIWKALSTAAQWYAKVGSKIILGIKSGFSFAAKNLTWGLIGKGAALNAAWSGINVAVKGGKFSDILRAAVKGAVVGAIGAVTGSFLHGFGAGAGGLLHTAAHGVVGGAMSAANGGKFKDGFIGGLIGHAVGGVFSNLTAGSQALQGITGVAVRTTVAAVSGGVGSVLSGGKFADGAYSAAFFHLFNSELSRPEITGVISELDTKLHTTHLQHSPAYRLIYNYVIKQLGFSIIYPKNLGLDPMTGQARHGSINYTDKTLSVLNANLEDATSWGDLGHELYHVAARNVLEFTLNPTKVASPPQEIIQLVNSLKLPNEYGLGAEYEAVRFENIIQRETFMGAGKELKQGHIQWDYSGHYLPKNTQYGNYIFK